MTFQYTYIPSGNGIVERFHHTIKCIATRSQCLIMEVVYWYNVTPKDDTTAPANSIHMYQAHIKGINVVPPREHTDPGIYKVDAVLVKTPHG